jgi:hypothetical protein
MTGPAQAISLTGLAGNLVSPVTGGSNPVNTLTDGAGALAGVGLSALGVWVLDGAKAALQETASVINRTTAPRLESTWFSATYWRVAGMAGLLTLPFLFAATLQALMRADLTLLVRSALGYLPLALIGVSLAAPLTMLLLAVTDEMCAAVAGAGSAGGVHFLDQTAVLIGGLSVLSGSPFMGFAVGLLTLAAAIALAIEMLIREAAVYIVLLMLPLAFSALVWPARRVWAIRLIELLIALILSKFVIVAVLALAGAAFGSQGLPSASRLLTAMSLVLLSTFAPWAMLRMLPFAELAAGAAGSLRAEVPRLARIPAKAIPAADAAAGLAESLPQRLRRDAERMDVPGEESGTDTRTERPRTARSEGGTVSASADRAALPPRPVPANAEVNGSGPAPVNGGVLPEVSGSGAADASARAAPVADGNQAGSPAQRRPLSETHPIWRAKDFTAPPFGLGPDGWPKRADYDSSEARPASTDDDAPLPRRQEDEDGPL